MKELSIEQKAKRYDEAINIAGRYKTLIEVQAYMRSINGEEAETWCDLAWKYVTRKIEEMTTF